MNYKEVISLINKIENSRFTNFKIKFEDLELELEKDCKNYNRKSSNEEVYIEESEPVVETKKVQKTEKTTDDFSDCDVVESPIVGVFYSKPAPDKEPFVKVGDKVKKGDVICIVEAMKVLNEIKSDFDGEVVQVAVNNEDVVEFGQPLIYIK